MWIRASRMPNIEGNASWQLTLGTNDRELLRIIDALEIATTPGREIDQHSRMTLYNFRAELNEATGMVTT